MAMLWCADHKSACNKAQLSLVIEFTDDYDGIGNDS